MRDSYTEFYHVYNKAIDNKQIFVSEAHTVATHFVRTFLYYRSLNSYLKYSIFRRLRAKYQLPENYIKDITNPEMYAYEIVAYCLMPNHYHLLLVEHRANTIKNQIGISLNSFTKYYNELHSRKGPVFLPSSKLKDIRTEEYFLHITRYIHINPYTSGIVSSTNQLVTYPFSSLNSYAYLDRRIVNPDYILSYFKDSEAYLQYVLDRAEYQKTLKICSEP